MQGKLCCTKRDKYNKLLLRSETRILSHFSHIENLTTRDIPINVVHPKTSAPLPTYLHTHTFQHPDPRAKEVVFFHGFGCPAVMYFCFLEELAKNYTVHAVDLLGMGCSGRPDIKYSALRASEITDLFVSCYEEWRKAMKLKNLNFVCHSLGSYFALKYSVRYPQNVDSILGLSTPMLTDFPHEFDVKKLNLPPKRVFIYYVWSFMNRRWLTAHNFFTLFPMTKMLNFWMKDRQCFPEEVKEDMTKYMALQFWDPHFSGDIVTELMGYLSYTTNRPVISFVDKFRDLGIKVQFVFGEKDWIDYKEFKALGEVADMDLDVVVVEGATHQLPLMCAGKCGEVVNKFMDKIEKEKEEEYG